MKITNLTTEQLKDPAGLDTLSPRFSWQVEDFAAGASQAAYRIEVASEKELLAQADRFPAQSVQMRGKILVELACQHHLHYFHSGFVGDAHSIVKG